MSCCVTGCNNKVTAVGVRFRAQHEWHFFCEEHIEAQSVDVARVSSEECLVRLIVNERKAYNTLKGVIDECDPAEIMPCHECKRYTPSEDEDSCLICKRMLPCKTWCDPDGEDREVCESHGHPEETNTYSICSGCIVKCYLCTAGFCGQPDCDGIDPTTGDDETDAQRICVYCRGGR